MTNQLVGALQAAKPADWTCPILSDNFVNASADRYSFSSDQEIYK